jgi:hypothetical protein
MNDRPIDAYLSTVQSFWPGGAEPQLRHRRASVRGHDGFFVLPDSKTPRMLVPMGNPRAASAAMMRFSAGLSYGDVAKRMLVSSALRGRGAPLFPDRIEITDSAHSLRDYLSEILGERVDFSLALGTVRANRKPVVEIFDRAGRSLAFAKIGSTPLAETHVQAEADALETLGKSDLPRQIEVPRLIHSGRWEQFLVLVMTSLTTSARQRPADQWSLPVQAMDDFHSSFSEGSVKLSESPMWMTLTDAHGMLPTGSGRERLGEALDTLASLAGNRPLDIGAWHGDWTAWNMGRVNGRIQLWDWERFGRGVPRGLDRCHYGVTAVNRRDGASVASVRAGLELAGVDHRDVSSEGFLAAGSYLAAISCRYLLSAQSELGHTIAARSNVMLDSLCSWVGVPSLGVTG